MESRHVLGQHPFDIDSLRDKLEGCSTVHCCRYLLVSPVMPAARRHDYFKAQELRARTTLIHVVVTEHLGEDGTSFRFVAAYDSRQPGYELLLNSAAERVIARALHIMKQRHLLWEECPAWLGMACPELMRNGTPFPGASSPPGALAA